MVIDEKRTDTVVRKEGMDALFEKLGLVDAERFITLVIKEPFDYTEWQKNLYNDMDVETLGKMSYEYCKNNADSAFGMLNKYANVNKIDEEKGYF